MFHLLVKFGGWAEGSDSLLASRIFEYTTPALGEQFKVNGSLDVSHLAGMPALFAPEVSATSDQNARIGTILRASSSGRDVSLNTHMTPSLKRSPCRTWKRCLRL